MQSSRLVLIAFILIFALNAGAVAAQPLQLVQNQDIKIQSITCNVGSPDQIDELWNPSQADDAKQLGLGPSVQRSISVGASVTKFYFTCTYNFADSVSWSAFEVEALQRATFENVTVTTADGIFQTFTSTQGALGPADRIRVQSPRTLSVKSLTWVVSAPCSNGNCVLDLAEVNPFPPTIAVTAGTESAAVQAEPRRVFLPGEIIKLAALSDSRKSVCDASRSICAWASEEPCVCTNRFLGMCTDNDCHYFCPAAGTRVSDVVFQTTNTFSSGACQSFWEEYGTKVLGGILMVVGVVMIIAGIGICAVGACVVSPWLFYGGAAVGAMGSTLMMYDPRMPLGDQWWLGPAFAINFVAFLATAHVALSNAIAHGVMDTAAATLFVVKFAVIAFAGPIVAGHVADAIFGPNAPVWGQIVTQILTTVALSVSVDGIGAIIGLAMKNSLQNSLTALGNAWTSWQSFKDVELVMLGKQFMQTAVAAGVSAVGTAVFEDCAKGKDAKEAGKCAILVMALTNTLNFAAQMLAEGLSKETTGVQKLPHEVQNRVADVCPDSAGCAVAIKLNGGRTQIEEWGNEYSPDAKIVGEYRRIYILGPIKQSPTGVPGVTTPTVERIDWNGVTSDPRFITDYPTIAKTLIFQASGLTSEQSAALTDIISPGGKGVNPNAVQDFRNIRLVNDLIDTQDVMTRLLTQIRQNVELAEQMSQQRKDITRLVSTFVEGKECACYGSLRANAQFLQDPVDCPGTFYVPSTWVTAFYGRPIGPPENQIYGAPEAGIGWCRAPVVEDQEQTVQKLASGNVTVAMLGSYGTFSQVVTSVSEGWATADVAAPQVPGNYTVELNVTVKAPSATASTIVSTLALSNLLVADPFKISVVQTATDKTIRIIDTLIANGLGGIAELRAGFIEFQSFLNSLANDNVSVPGEVVGTDFYDNVSLEKSKFDDIVNTIDTIIARERAGGRFTSLDQRNAPLKAARDGMASILGSTTMMKLIDIHGKVRTAQDDSMSMPWTIGVNMPGIHNTADTLAGSVDANYTLLWSDVALGTDHSRPGLQGVYLDIVSSFNMNVTRATVSDVYIPYTFRVLGNYSGNYSRNYTLNADLVGLINQSVEAIYDLYNETNVTEVSIRNENVSFDDALSAWMQKLSRAQTLKRNIDAMTAELKPEIELLYGVGSTINYYDSNYQRTVIKQVIFPNNMTSDVAVEVTETYFNSTTSRYDRRTFMKNVTVNGTALAMDRFSLAKASQTLVLMNALSDSLGRVINIATDTVSYIRAFYSPAMYAAGQGMEDSFDTITGMLHAIMDSRKPELSDIVNRTAVEAFALMDRLSVAKRVGTVDIPITVVQPELSVAARPNIECGSGEEQTFNLSVRADVTPLSIPIRAGEWTPFSVPWIPKQTLTLRALAPDCDAKSLVWWDAGSQQTFTEAIAESASLLPGRGYYLLSNNDCSLRFGSDLFKPYGRFNLSATGNEQVGGGWTLVGSAGITIPFDSMSLINEQNAEQIPNLWSYQMSRNCSPLRYEIYDDFVRDRKLTNWTELYEAEPTVDYPFNVSNINSSNVSGLKHVQWVEPGKAYWVRSNARCGLYSLPAMFPTSVEPLARAVAFKVLTSVSTSNTVAALGAAASAAGGTGRVVRTLSITPSGGEAGVTVTATLDVRIPNTNYYYAIDEVLPGPDWAVTSASSGGDFTRAGHVYWICQSGCSNTTYTYTVVMPANVSEQSRFTGVYSMTAGSVTAGNEVPVETPIAGMDTIAVVPMPDWNVTDVTDYYGVAPDPFCDVPQSELRSCTELPNAAGNRVSTSSVPANAAAIERGFVSRTIGVLPTRAAEDMKFSVNLSVLLQSGTQHYGIEEIVPAGWTVTGASGGGDWKTRPGNVTDPGRVFWICTQNCASVIYSYNVTVPVASHGTYNFSGIYDIYTAQRSSETSIFGTTTVMILSASAVNATICETLNAYACVGASNTTRIFSVRPESTGDFGYHEVRFIATSPFYDVSDSALVRYYLSPTIPSITSAALREGVGVRYAVNVTNTDPQFCKARPLYMSIDAPEGWSKRGSDSVTIDPSRPSSLQTRIAAASFESVLPVVSGIVSRRLNVVSSNTAADIRVSVDLNVSLRESMQYGIDEVVPENWTVIGASGGGNWTAWPGHVSWLCTQNCQSTTYSYNVTAPPTSNGTYDFTGVYAVGSSGEMPIVGERTIEVVPVSTSELDWTVQPMAGRAASGWSSAIVTSDVSDLAKSVRPEFYRQGFTPCVPSFAQDMSFAQDIVAGDGKMLYSTAEGIYAFDEVDCVPSETPLVSGVIRGIAYVNGKLFWVDQWFGIKSCDMSSGKSCDTGSGSVSNIATVDSSSEFVHIAADAQAVYWAEDDSIRRATLDGSVFTIATNLTSPQGIDVDSSYVYWAEPTRIGKVAKNANCQGAACETIGIPDYLLPRKDGRFYDVASDGTRIFVTLDENGYFSVPLGSRVYANSSKVIGINATSGGVAFVYMPPVYDELTNVAVGPSYVYWISDGNVDRMNKFTAFTNTSYFLSVPGHVPTVAGVTPREGRISAGTIATFNVTMMNNNSLNDSVEAEMRFGVKDLALPAGLQLCSSRYIEGECEGERRGDGTIASKADILNDYYYFSTAYTRTIRIGQNASIGIYVRANASLAVGTRLPFNITVGSADPVMDTTIDAAVVIIEPGPPVLELVQTSDCAADGIILPAGYIRPSCAVNFSLHVTNTEIRNANYQINVTQNDRTPVTEYWTEVAEPFVLSVPGTVTYDNIREAKLSIAPKNAMYFAPAYGRYTFNVSVRNAEFPINSSSTYLTLIVTPDNRNGICEISRGERPDNTPDCALNTDIFRCVFGDECDSTTENGVAFGISPITGLRTFAVCNWTRGNKQQTVADCTAQLEAANRGVFCSGVERCSRTCREEDGRYFAVANVNGTWYDSPVFDYACPICIGKVTSPLIDSDFYTSIILHPEFAGGNVSFGSWLDYVRSRHFSADWWGMDGCSNAAAGVVTKGESYSGRISNAISNPELCAGLRGEVDQFVINSDKLLLAVCREGGLKPDLRITTVSVANVTYGQNATASVTVLNNAGESAYAKVRCRFTSPPFIKTAESTCVQMQSGSTETFNATFSGATVGDWTADCAVGWSTFDDCSVVVNVDSDTARFSVSPPPTKLLMTGFTIPLSGVQNRDVYIRVDVTNYGADANASVGCVIEDSAGTLKEYESIIDFVGWNRTVSFSINFKPDSAGDWYVRSRTVYHRSIKEAQQTITIDPAFGKIVIWPMCTSVCEAAGFEFGGCFAGGANPIGTFGDYGCPASELCSCGNVDVNDARCVRTGALDMSGTYTANLNVSWQPGDLLRVSGRQFTSHDAVFTTSFQKRGTYTINATVYKGAVPVFQKPTRVECREKPDATITNPVDWAVVKGTQGVSARFVDADNVSLYIDDTQVLEDVTNIVRYNWDTTAWPDGPHTLMADACNEIGCTLVQTHAIVKNTIAVVKNMVAVPTYGFTMDPLRFQSYVSAGETATYTFSIANTGTASDSYTFSETLNVSWPMSVALNGELLRRTVALTPGETTTFVIQIRVPSIARTGDTVALTVTAASSKGASKTSGPHTIRVAFAPNSPPQIIAFGTFAIVYMGESLVFSADIRDPDGDAITDAIICKTPACSPSERWCKMVLSGGTYGCTVPGPSPGNYTYYAYAVDSNGLSTLSTDKKFTVLEQPLPVGKCRNIIDRLYGATARATSSLPAQSADNVLDGDGLTYWVSQSPLPQSITIDLGSIRWINTTGIYTGSSGRPKAFDISVGDCTNFINVVGETNAQYEDNLYSVSFDAVQGRCVKMDVRKAENADYAAIGSVEACAGTAPQQTVQLSSCGNGVCDPGETAYNCPSDCKAQSIVPVTPGETPIILYVMAVVAAVALIVLIASRSRISLWWHYTRG